MTTNLLATVLVTVVTNWNAVSITMPLPTGQSTQHEVGTIMEQRMLIFMFEREEYSVLIGARMIGSVERDVPVARPYVQPMPDFTVPWSGVITGDVWIVTNLLWSITNHPVMLLNEGPPPMPQAKVTFADTQVMPQAEVTCPQTMPKAR